MCYNLQCLDTSLKRYARNEGRLSAEREFFIAGLHLV